jgi:O-antigen/teichoic acid export membrane protein
MASGLAETPLTRVLGLHLAILDRWRFSWALSNADTESLEGHNSPNGHSTVSIRSRLTRALGRQEESLSVQTVVLTAARVVGFFFIFAVPIVLVRVFDQYHFGLYKQFFLFADTLPPLLALGMGGSLFYFVPRDAGDGQRYVLQALAVAGVMGLSAWLLLLLAPDLVARLFNVAGLRSFFPLLGFYVLAALLARIATLLPTIDRRPFVAGAIIAGTTVVSAVGVVGAALLLRTLGAVLWTATAAIVFQGLVAGYYLRRRRRPGSARPSLGALREQLVYSLPYALSLICEIGLHRFHQYYVTGQTDPAEFAIYSIGLLQLPFLGFIIQSVVEVMLVRLASAHKAGDREEMQRVWLTSVERLTVILVPCFALAQLMAADLIVLLFGPDYAGSVPIFRVFILGLPLAALVDESILRATGDTRYLVVRNSVGFVTSVVAILLLARYSLLMGTIGGYFCGFAVARVLGVVKVGNRLELSWREILPWRYLVRLALAILASSGLAALAFLFPFRVVRILITPTVFFAAYGLIVLRWQILPRQQVIEVLRRFRSSFTAP